MPDTKSPWASRGKNGGRSGFRGTAAPRRGLRGTAAGFPVGAGRLKVHLKSAFQLLSPPRSGHAWGAVRVLGRSDRQGRSGEVESRPLDRQRLASWVRVGDGSWQPAEALSMKVSVILFSRANYLEQLCFLNNKGGSSELSRLALRS